MAELKYVKYATKNFDELLSWARDEKERLAIHNAYNIGHTDGEEQQQHRCSIANNRKACIYYDGPWPRKRKE